MRTITIEQYEHGEDQYVGYCTECGGERCQTESDVENYPCDACGMHAVLGVHWWLVSGRVI